MYIYVYNAPSVRTCLKGQQSFAPPTSSNSRLPSLQLGKERREHVLINSGPVVENEILGAIQSAYTFRIDRYYCYYY